MNIKKYCDSCGKPISHNTMTCTNCGLRYIIDWDAEDERLWRREFIGKIIERGILIGGIVAVSIAAIGLANAIHAYAADTTSIIAPDTPDRQCAICLPIKEPSHDAPQDDIQTGTQFRITAYCPCRLCCGESSDGVTASGTYARQGRTIAVDPSIIPLGSTVTIDGHTYIAEDVGSAIKGNRIDVYFDSHADALAFGVKYTELSTSNVEKFVQKNQPDGVTGTTD